MRSIYPYLVVSVSSPRDYHNSYDTNVVVSHTLSISHYIYQSYLIDTLNASMHL
jgi:hypothetical protein